MVNPLHKDHGPLVDWRTIEQREFDRLIEALIPLQHQGDNVQIVDGRGGDGGRDAVVLRVDDRTVIYQLKCFPEGFDGKHKGRRKQITNPTKNRIDWGSLEHALEHAPDEWVLVAPCNPSISGWAWIEQLKKTYADRVKITFIGRAQLDGPNWCGGHQDVVRALFTRDETLVKMQIANRERDVLARPGDLSERLRALGGVVDDIDPAWTLDFARVGDVTVQTLRAKHPLAAKTNPITFNFTVHGPATDPRITEFRTAIDYGSFTPAVLPGEFIAGFSAAGSPLVESDELEGVIRAIELHPDIQAPQNQRVSLVLRDSDETMISSDTGAIGRVARGSKGVTLEQVLHSALVLTWRLPTDLAEPGNIGVAFDSSLAMDAGELLKAMRLAQSFSRAATLELQVGSKVVMRGELADTSNERIARQVDGDRALLETVEDLAYIQQETNSYFPVPETIEPLDRIWLRVFRVVLQGGMCFEPQRRARFNMTFKPEAAQDEALKPFLVGRSLMFLVANQNPTLEFGDHTMTLPGELAFVMRSGSLQDSDSVRAGLERGQETPVVVSADTDEHLVVYMPARVPKNSKVEPGPWGLTGINEVAELTQQP